MFDIVAEFFPGTRALKGPRSLTTVFGFECWRT